MPNEKKPDPFKPQQPNIPGVSPGSAGRVQAAPEVPQSNNPAHTTSPQPLAWIIVAVTVAAMIGVGVIHSRRISAEKMEQPTADASMVVPPIESAAKPIEGLPIAPGPVATEGEMAKTWSAKRFLFRDPITNQAVPAMIVRLPQGGYWGFSLRAPFGTCELEYVADLERLQAKYQFRAEHPMVIDPCNETIYDLAKYGAGASSDSLVRGEMVRGPGIRPPIAIEIRTRGKEIIAVRMEGQ
jgi:hypothetical protein